MCLEMLGKVLEIGTAADATHKADCGSIPDRTALVEVDGVTRQVSLAVLDLEGTTVTSGDWILAHTGLALRVLDEAAARTLTDQRNEILASSNTAPLAENVPLRGGGTT